MTLGSRDIVGLIYSMCLKGCKCSNPEPDSVFLFIFSKKNGYAFPL
jgi:hypothetical protein